MKNIRFIQKEVYNDKLFDYPCINSNSRFLQNKKVCIFDTDNIVNTEWFTELGTDVLINPDNGNVSFFNIGIVAPIKANTDDDKGYYQIIDYYIETLQLFIHKLKDMPGFNHIVVILPEHSDEYSTSLIQMAYYAVYGLIKGLGERYAPYGLFINGIILNKDPRKGLQNWLFLLSSDNSNNIVGQVFKL